jgi:hypothetical protein
LNDMLAGHITRCRPVAYGNNQRLETSRVKAPITTVTSGMMSEAPARSVRIGNTLS